MNEWEFILEIFDVLIPEMEGDQVCFDYPRTQTIVYGENEWEVPYTFGNIIGFNDKKHIILQITCQNDDEYELTFPITIMITKTNILQLMKEKIEEIIKTNIETENVSVSKVD